MHTFMLHDIAASDPDRRLLICPVCGSPRMVPINLNCRGLGPHRGEVAVGRQGLRVDPTGPIPEGGAIVDLHYTCEQKHHVIIRFRQVRDTTVIEQVVPPWTSYAAGIRRSS
jgi:hypothetical protein